MTAVLAQVVWLVIREAISLGVSPEQGTEQELTVDTLIGLTFKYVSSSGLGIGGPVGTAIVVSWIAQWVAVAGVLGLAAVARPGTRASAFAYATLLMALLLGPLLAVSIRLSTGEYFALPERYGLSLYPFFIACAALLVRRASDLHGRAGRLGDAQLRLRVVHPRGLSAPTGGSGLDSPPSGAAS